MHAQVVCTLQHPEDLLDIVVVGQLVDEIGLVPPRFLEVLRFCDVKHLVVPRQHLLKGHGFMAKESMWETLTSCASETAC